MRAGVLEKSVDVFRQGKEIYSGPVGQRPVLAEELPALILHMTKYPHNIGQAIRIASCYGVTNVWTCGGRVDLRPYDGYRLPREERMRGYADVSLHDFPDPLEAILARNPEAVPVAVEMLPKAESLPHFIHPEKAVYILGPEDGSLPGSVLKRCHRFVRIPTRYCLNLAISVGTILYDRTAKQEIGL